MGCRLTASKAFIISILLIVAFFIYAPLKLEIDVYRESHERIIGRDYVVAPEEPQLQDLLEKCHQPPDKIAYLMTANTATQEDVEQKYLKTCFPIEISTSQGGRSMGHCSGKIGFLL